MICGFGLLAERESAEGITADVRKPSPDPAKTTMIPIHYAILPPQPFACDRRRSGLMIRGRTRGRSGTEGGMPRRAKGLTAVLVEKGTKPGRYGDGAGLYLL